MSEQDRSGRAAFADADAQPNVEVVQSPTTVATRKWYEKGVVGWARNHPTEAVRNIAFVLGGIGVVAGGIMFGVGQEHLNTMGNLATQHSSIAEVGKRFQSIPYHLPKDYIQNAQHELYQKYISAKSFQAGLSNAGELRKHGLELAGAGVGLGIIGTLAERFRRGRERRKQARTTS